MSCRHSESICSGAIPVLIADDWVPPFESLVPFEKYGVMIKEKDAEKIVSELRQIPPERVKLMQWSALRFCYRHIISVHKQWDTMLQLLLSDAIN